MKRTIAARQRFISRTSRLSIAVLTAALIAAACGSDSSETQRPEESSSAEASSAVTTTAAADTSRSEESTSTAEEAETEDLESAFPVTITNRLGQVTIESAPTRIIALGTNDIDVVYGLGLNPIAVAINNTTGGLAPWLQDSFSTDGVEILTVYPEMPFEQIAALNPDIILASPLPTIDANYELLNEIAPVIADTNGVLTDTWQERTRKIGAALGLGAAAEALVENGEATIAAIAANNPELDGQTYTMAFAQSDTMIAVMAADDVTSQIFAQLGLSIPESVLELAVNDSGGVGTGAATVSMETLDNLEADIVVVGFLSPDLQSSMTESPIFQALPAVNEDRFVAIDLAALGAFRAPSALALEWMFSALNPLVQTN